MSILTVSEQSRWVGIRRACPVTCLASSLDHLDQDQIADKCVAGSVTVQASCGDVFGHFRSFEPPPHPRLRLAMPNCLSKHLVGRKLLQHSISHVIISAKACPSSYKSQDGTAWESPAFRYPSLDIQKIPLCSQHSPIP